MASVDKVGTGWRARWRTPEGESRSKTFAKKVDAERWLTHTEHTKLRGTHTDPTAGKVTFGDYAGAWVSNQVWRPSTTVRVETIVTTHLEPRFGKMAMASITPSHVQTMVKSLSETMAPGTVRGVYSALAAIFRTAIRDRVVANSPATPDIRLPEVAQRRVVPLALEQVETLADAVGPLYRPLVVLGAGAGLRVGEALGMPAGGIDFPRRQLSVTQQAVTVRRVTSIAEPKTKTSVRTIPLADAVLAELAGHLEGRKTKPADLLVADKDGAPIPQNRFSQTWARAVHRSGLPAGTRFHDLRHTYASALIASGCSVKVVQGHLGHKSAAMTLDIYSHLWPQDDDRARAAVQTFFVGGVSSVCHDEATG
jgi:integrase